MRPPRLLLPLLVLALSGVACQKEVAVSNGAGDDGASQREVTGADPGAGEDGSDPAVAGEAPSIDGQQVTAADCWVTITYTGEGATQEWEGPIAGDAAYAGTSGRSLAVLNVDLDEQRTDDVRTLSLTAREPRFAQVTFSYPDEPTGMTLGELGTYEVQGGARLNAGPDVPFNVAGTLEFTITRSEFQQTDGGPRYIDAFAGTFRNVGPLLFQNPFPENGKRGEVTDLHGEFNIDRRGCPIL